MGDRKWEIGNGKSDGDFEVKGHHNLLFCGHFARRFRRFAQLFRMRLASTGFKGPWPM